jgi:hypothetical protein
MKIFHLADCSRAPAQVKPDNGTEITKRDCDYLCKGWFIITITDHLNLLFVGSNTKKCHVLYVSALFCSAFCSSAALWQF